MAEIGKNVIENLTTAMYENAYTVYREYIQNSADSIDKAIAEGLISENDAFIDINIEYNKRRITCREVCQSTDRYCRFSKRPHKGQRFPWNWQAGRSGIL